MYRKQLSCTSMTYNEKENYINIINRQQGLKFNESMDIQARTLKINLGESLESIRQTTINTSNQQEPKSTRLI